MWRRPIGASLTDGSICALRAGGAWPGLDPDRRYAAWAGCNRCTEGYALWSRFDANDHERTRARTVQYQVGYFENFPSLHWVDVRTRYWIA